MYRLGIQLWLSKDSESLFIVVFNYLKYSDLFWTSFLITNSVALRLNESLCISPPLINKGWILLLKLTNDEKKTFS